MSFLELINIRKSFGATAAVEHFNLQAEKGEFISFLGSSGCGKTTTLRMIAGFEQPTEGEIRVGGVNITNQPPNRRQIGMVFQSYALFPNMTVADNIGFGLRVVGKPATKIRSRVEEMLHLVDLPALGRRYPHQLSGGQQQRVALARALAIEPRLLLLDEPLSALDAKIRISLRNELRAIQQRLGITTIYVTHDQEEALSLSDRIVVMSKGRIEQIGTPFEIYNYPSTSFVASFVGTLNILSAKVINADKGELEIAGHHVYTAEPLNHHSGVDISVAVRPENLEIGSNLVESHNTIPVSINQVSFLGAVVRVRLQLADKTLEMDIFNSRHLKLPEVGTEIQVSFPKEACLVLKGS
ncbi:ABC transporter ATP-binding protein [Candidatus Chlorohelix sp.]|uniref:ABC transporter ATP-binding protein n=1 Tax=Candidatus Chlorohelix sp. TaxID=3139201 RepID=UPI0030680524